MIGYDMGAYTSSYGSSVSNAMGGINGISGIGILAFVFLLIVGAVALLVCVALMVYAYVFASLSLQKLASRRNVSKPWLAWIPVCSVWLLGELASDYDRQNGKDTHWGSKLLTFYFICFGFVLANNCLSGSIELIEQNLDVALLSLLLSFIVFAFSIVCTVITYICFYKIFKSTAGDNAIVYFLISLFVPLAQPICLFLCRNKGYPYVVEEPENII